MIRNRGMNEVAAVVEVVLGRADDLIYATRHPSYRFALLGGFPFLSHAFIPFPLIL